MAFLTTLLFLLLLWAAFPTLLMTAPRTDHIKVTATAYSSEAGQTDADPFTAACGPVRPGTIAVSRDLLALYPCGTIVRLDGRRYVVNDTMNARFTRRVDVWMDSRVAALRFGIRHGATLEVPYR